jgi:hypothetical protein
MTLKDKIKLAFEHRTMPQTLATPGARLTGDDDNANWFSGKDWRDLTQEDWEVHYSAVAFFSREAFAYYLPSILSLTADGQCDLLAADQIIGSLDRSPTIAHWDDWLSTRLLGLTDEEYEVMKEWLLSLSGCDIGFNGEDGLTRAYQTVDLLQQETNRIGRQGRGETSLPLG